jgi:hypothetical protein
VLVLAEPGPPAENLGQITQQNQDAKERKVTEPTVAAEAIFSLANKMCNLSLLGIPGA